VMLALGVAGWLRYGGRLRVPALALLLLAPLLPSLPAPLPDVRLIGSFLAQVRSRPAAPAVDPREASCLAERPRVIAEQAARIAWQHDLVAIYAPVQPEALRRIVAEHPVALVQLRDERRKPPPAFEPRADCGEGWYAPGR